MRARKGILGQKENTNVKREVADEEVSKRYIGCGGYFC